MGVDRSGAVRRDAPDAVRRGAARCGAMRPDAPVRPGRVDELVTLGWALLLACFAAVPLGLTIWALLDAARRPEWAWALTGRRRVVWMALIMFSALTVIGGMTVSVWYLARVRPEVAAAESGV